MGVLVRHTRTELAELVRSDPEWWPHFLSDISESGYAAVEREKKMRHWAWGALKAWMREEPRRIEEYEASLRDYAEKCLLESIPISDAATPEDVAVAKLRGDRRVQIAGKLDRKWRDSVEVNETRRYVIEVPMVAASTADWRKSIEDAQPAHLPATIEQVEA